MEENIRNALPEKGSNDFAELLFVDLDLRHFCECRNFLARLTFSKVIVPFFRQSIFDIFFHLINDG
jgi:hypothetical protein